VEEPKRVALRPWAAHHLPSAALPRRLDHLPRKTSADSAAPEVGCDRQRFELRLLPAPHHRRQSNDAPIDFGHPDVTRSHLAEVRIEVAARISSADHRIGVELPVPLRQLDPEAADLQVRVAVQPDEY
jgi:hypothetical protein